MPGYTVVGVYSAVIHYLRAVEALGSHADGKAVIAKMKELPTEDKLMGKGYVRIDGRKIHPMYLFEVKKPEESKAPWDYYKQLATIPAEEAWRPLDQGECPLVKVKLACSSTEANGRALPVVRVSFDHLVSAQQKRRRHSDTDRFCCL